MNTFKRGYVLKAAGLLILLGAVAAALIFGPALRRPPRTESPTELPAMTNIPPAGTLHIETAAETSADETRPEQ